MKHLSEGILKGIHKESSQAKRKYPVRFLKEIKVGVILGSTLAMALYSGKYRHLL